MVTFDTVGDSVAITLPLKGENATFALTDSTFDMEIKVQKEVGSPGSGAWRTLKTFIDNVAISYTVSAEFNGQTFRAIVTVDTSGSETATWTDNSDAQLAVLKSALGDTLYQFLQSGLVIPGAVDIQGALTSKAVAGGNVVTAETASFTAGAAHVNKTTPITVGASTITIATDVSGVVFLSDQSANDLVTMNGTTSGGLPGTRVRFTDVGTDLWEVSGHVKASGAETTPFSGT